MPTPRETLPAKSTGVVELRRLFDIVDKEYEDGASVTCTLLDRANNPVSGATNIPMAHVVGTAGAGTVYLGEIDAAANIPVGVYDAEVVAVVAATGAKRTFYKSVRIQPE